ncbi:hypothetical protein GCM10023149_42650 [Mucilaginibacter gynuensis]|uniref:Uncharacterized protein n=1 Tax=Mucilaginibacter gynuensis TaxID=1302236 RepID=A0ABP8H661_9SPHI
MNKIVTHLEVRDYLGVNWLVYLVKISISGQKGQFVLVKHQGMRIPEGLGSMQNIPYNQRTN